MSVTGTERSTTRRVSGTSKIDATREALREGILRGTWPIGSRIPKEPELMELFGVGKSTVREAVKSLAYVGMLEPIKGVGTFVRSMSPVNAMMDQRFAAFPLEQILIVRRALEIEAAQLAAVNRTEGQLALLRESFEYDLTTGPDAPRAPSRGELPGSFHHLVFEAAGSPLMSELFTAIMSALRQARMRGAALQGSAHDIRHLDHGALLEAIEQQDVAQAAHVMALHVDRDLIPVDGVDEAIGAICDEFDPETPTRRARILNETLPPR